MLDSLHSLQQFHALFGNIWRLRPYWNVKYNIAERDTCLYLTHTNIKLILSALHNGKIKSYNSHEKFL